MAQQSSFYFTDGTTRTYPSSKHIASKQHVAVYFKSVATSTWAVIEASLYDLVNNSIVFTDSPDSALYSEIEIRVADTAAELTDSPSDIATLASNIANVNTVAGSIADVHTVATNIASVTTVSGSITNVNNVGGSIANVNTVAGSIADVDTVAANILDVVSVADTIVPNITEILLAGTNAATATTQAGIATTQAGLASTSATNAQLSVWEAEAEKMTADSYATEAEDVFAKTYTSNGDGTFTATDTTEYSALHWAAKSALSAQGDAVNISYDNATSGMTAINVQTAIDEIDTRSDTHIPLSGITAYHLIQGNLALANSVVTAGMATTLYTGTGDTQSINTGVDMDTQWGNSATERFGGLVWVKGRSTVSNHHLADTIRGATYALMINATDADQINARSLTAFNSDGFSIGRSINANLVTYASWNFQTTHRRTSVTNHGKTFTEHYNPYTGFTMIEYEGSGLTGHVIPHSLGRRLSFVTTKNTGAVANWTTQYKENSYLYINTTQAETTSPNVINTFTENSITLPTSDATQNRSTNQYIMYGWANSYFDEANTLIGNYETGVYQGTGGEGNKITTRAKPAWILIKRLDSTGNWLIVDNKRLDNNTLYPNLSDAEGVGSYQISVTSNDGFVVSSTNSDSNASGGQYLYMVVYDNDSGSGKSKYPRATDTSTLNLNAIIPFANGIDASGTKNTVLTKNETVTGLTLTEGKNYIYAKNDGLYGVTPVNPEYGTTNPATGDFYNVLENQWYTSAGVAITESRNYLDAIVYADAGGQPYQVAQLPKTEYKDSLELRNLSVVGGFDLNETRHDLTAINVANANYPNTSGKKKKVSITIATGATATSYLEATINGVVHSYTGNNSDTGSAFYILEFEVLPGETYKVVKIGTVTISKWRETY